MSISSMLNIARSGMSTAQDALRYTSQNVTNVNTDGYVRKDYRPESVVVGGDPSGVKRGAIERTIDTILETNMREARSDIHRYEIREEVNKSLQNVFGDPHSDNSVNNKFDEAMRTFGKMTTDPTQVSTKLEGIRAFQDFGREVERLATEVQNFRADADRRLGTEIIEANQIIDAIYELNNAVVDARAASGDSSSLEEQRSIELNKLSEKMDISIVSKADGKVHVYAGKGLPLVDHGKYHLYYSQAGSASPSSRFTQIETRSVDLATGTLASSGSKFDPEVRSGSIKGLLDMRDQELPQLAEELGNMSGQITWELNKLHNRYSAVPPVNTLTGTNSGLVAGDAHGFGNAGTISFAIVSGTNGTLVDRVDIDLAVVGATMNDIVTAVNAGLAGNGTMTLSNGVLSLDATAAANGAVVYQDPSQATNPTRGGKEFSHFFGMNDMMKASVPTDFDSGFTNATAHGFTAGQTIELEIRGPSNETTTSVTYTMVAGQTFNDIFTSVQASFSTYIGSMSLDSNGALAVTMNSAYSNYELRVVNDQTDRGSTGKTLTDLIGVGTAVKQNRAFQVDTTSNLQSDSRNFAYATFKNAATAAGDVALGTGDTTGPVGFQDLMDKSVTFDQSGSIPQTTSTISGYIGIVIQEASTNSSNATGLKQQSESLHTQLEVRWNDVSGVNIDEEMANMILFQNAFSASARIINAGREMFDQLLQIA